MKEATRSTLPLSLPLATGARLLGAAWARTGVAPGWLYQSLERIGTRFPAGRRVRRMHNGLRMECDLRDHVQRQIYFFGGYEPIETELFTSLLEPGDTVVDAGGNVGFHALMAAERVGPSGAVHTFEPIPENLLILRRHVELNGLSGHVRVIPRALWHRAEKLRFRLGHAHAANAGGYSAATRGESLRELECEAVTLDDHVAAHGIARVAAIKMDIEGAERFALQGAARTLREHRPLIFLEVCRETCAGFGYHPSDLWQPLQPLGYRIYRMGSTRAASGWVPDFGGIEQSNVLLFPDGFARRFNERWDDKAIRRKFARSPR
jgi:FkbM family methyltransferase